MWHFETLDVLGVFVVEKRRGDNLVSLWDASVGAKEYLWWSDQLWLGVIPS